MNATKRWTRRARAATAAVGRLRRDFETELTSRMLVAAMLIPVVEAAFGWRAHTPLDAPLTAHALILAALVFLAPAPTAREQRDTDVPRGLLWLPVPIVAVMLAIVLNLRSNIFYTARALVEGMALLLLVHYAGRHLRRRVLVRREATVPAVRLADSLTTIVGWSLLLSWLLIALEHRHPVGPMLIAAGALETIAFVMLVPDALPDGRWRRTLGRRRERDDAAHLKIVRGDAPPPARSAGHRNRRRA
jgi:hypothetical protein